MTSLKLLVMIILFVLFCCISLSEVSTNCHTRSFSCFYPMRRILNNRISYHITVNWFFTGLVGGTKILSPVYTVRNPVYPNTGLYKTYRELFPWDWNSRSGMCEIRYNRVRYKSNWLYSVYCKLYRTSIDKTIFPCSVRSHLLYASVSKLNLN